MQLWQLGLLVAAGISFIVGLVHVTGGSRKARLENADAALRRFAEDFPEAAATAVVLTRAGDAAILGLSGGAGVVQAVGDCFLTRLLKPGEVNKLAVSGASVDAAFADFTFPKARWMFAGPDEATRAFGVLKSLTRGETAHA